jgi:hypothetical protein
VLIATLPWLILKGTIEQSVASKIDYPSAFAKYLLLSQTEFQLGMHIERSAGVISLNHTRGYNKGSLRS